MKLQEAINITDKMVVNDFDNPTKTEWLNELEEMIQSEVFESLHVKDYVWESTYEGDIQASEHTIELDNGIDARDYGHLILTNCDIAGTYTVVHHQGNEFTVKETLGDYNGTAKVVFTNKDTELLLPKEWEKLYYKWLIAKVNFANLDYDLYADTSEYFNDDWTKFVKWFCYHFIDNRKDKKCYRRLKERH